SFAVRNDGDQELQILDAKPACSCTLVPDFPRLIKPGETAMLPAVLDTKHKFEKVDVALDLTTNEPAMENHHQLRITGRVRAVCQIYPVGTNFFYNITPGQQQTKRITLKNVSGQPLKMELMPQKPESPFKVSLEATKPTQEFTAVVTAVGPFKEGATQETVEM